MLGRGVLREEEDGSLYIADTPVKGAVPGSMQPAPRQIAVHLASIKTAGKQGGCAQCGAQTYHRCPLCMVHMCKLTVDKACCLVYHMVGAGVEAVLGEMLE
jgi:hypothetical protein